MATTGLPRTTQMDLTRVTESLEMLAPRWSVWTLMTLSTGPLRYTEIKRRLPWLLDGQLHPRLRKLTDAGLVERNEHSLQHVTYGLTARGTDLLPVLTVIAAWGATHLEPAPVGSEKAEKHEPLAQAAPAQNIEDTLALLSPRHATPILWVLKTRGAAGAKSVAAEAMPGYRLSAVYTPLDRLVEDRLVDKDASVYQLSSSGLGLAPVYQAVSAWAAGHRLTDVGTHPEWGGEPSPSQSAWGPWLSTQSRVTAPAALAAPAAPAVVPALDTQAPATAWKGGDLFSHQIPARPLSLPSGGGQRR